MQGVRKRKECPLKRFVVWVVKPIRYMKEIGTSDVLGWGSVCRHLQ